MLKEILTNTNKKGMISWMETHPEMFDELVGMALSDDPEYAWRAAWLLWSCITENDPRIMGRIKDFVDALPKKPGPQQRELLILLSKMQIEPEMAGEVFEYCVQIWINPTLQASLRYNAFKLMCEVAKIYPGLKSELQLLLEDDFFTGLTENVRKSVFRMMKGLERKK
ncbi:MAG TPA: hypothetical protein PLU49_06680 [Saprospiraceae bacterium]|nr:hypothetical protein [Saprospiraceae bacterium]